MYYLCSQIRCKITPFFQNMQIKMKKNDKRFRNFVENASKKDVESIKEHVLYFCKVSLSSYYKWLYGTATPNIERRIAINGIAYKFNYPVVYVHVKGYRKQSKILNHDTK